VKSCARKMKSGTRLLSTPDKSTEDDKELASCLRLRPELEGSHALASTPVPLPYAKGSKASLRFASVVETFLSDDECKSLMALANRRGFDAAQINVGGGRQQRDDEFRKSGRCIIDSSSFAQVLWQRLQPLLPNLHQVHDGFIRGWWEPVGLNERMRILRYGPGDYFKPHLDGSFEYPVGNPRYGERSFMTLMLYLDMPEKGGETNFINEYDKSRVTSICPNTGLALVFEHGLLHEGGLLKQGVKHCIRTDVMFRRCQPPCHPRLPTS